MRRLLLALILSLTPSLRAAEPRATISGPTSAAVGEPILLHLEGSASDPEYPLQVEVAGTGDFKPSLRLWYDESKQPGLVVLTAPSPGSFVVVVVAIGRPEGPTRTVTRIAAWPITISDVRPGPAPKPPGPTPTPDPQPNPQPAPVVGKLYGMLVVPDSPTFAESSLRTSPKIRAAFAAIPETYYPSYLASETEVQSSAGYKSALATAGGPPAVLWITVAGGVKVVKATGAATEEKILADLKVLRGGN